MEHLDVINVISLVAAHMQTAQTKYCPRCDKTKSVDEFSRSKSTRDGLRSYCQACDRKINAEAIQQNQNKNKERDPYDTTLKVCSGCKEVMPRSKQFWTPAPSCPDGLGRYCLDCKCIADMRGTAKRRKEPWNPPVPLTGKEARALKKQQDYRCFVCDKKENGERLSLDHSHYTGKIRGYACATCNEGLIRWLDYMWYIHKDKRDWVKSDPIFYQILWHPPAEYLYDPL